MFNEKDKINLQIHLFENITRIKLGEIVSHVASQKIVRQMHISWLVSKKATQPIECTKLCSVLSYFENTRLTFVKRKLNHTETPCRHSAGKKNMPCTIMQLFSHPLKKHTVYWPYCLQSVDSWVFFFFWHWFNPKLLWPTTCLLLLDICAVSDLIEQLKSIEPKKSIWLSITVNRKARVNKLISKLNFLKTLFIRGQEHQLSPACINLTCLCVISAWLP